MGRPRHAAQRDHQRSDSRPTSGPAAPPPEEKNFVPDLHFVEISQGPASLRRRARAEPDRGVHDARASSCRSSTSRPNTPSRGDGLRRSHQHEDAAVRHHLQAGDLARSRSRSTSTSRTGRTTTCGSSTARAARRSAASAATARYAGQFHWINAIAMDSKGNIYTGEVEQNKRIQKFVPVIEPARRKADRSNESSCPMLRRSARPGSCSSSPVRTGQLLDQHPVFKNGAPNQQRDRCSQE